MRKLRRPGLWAFLGWLMLSILSFHPLSAQSPGARRITGIVTAQGTGAFISGATVTVKGTRNSTTTDEKGNFTITASSEERLVISNIGYGSKEVKVGNSTSLSIALNLDFSHLEDVVVVGYGKM